MNCDHAHSDEHQERRRARLRRAGSDITAQHRHTVIFMLRGGLPPAAPRHREAISTRPTRKEAWHER